MADNLTQIVLSQIIPLAVGAVSTAVTWAARAIYKAKTDIDFAHAKIRELDRILAEQNAELLDLTDRISYLEE